MGLYRSIASCLDRGVDAPVNREVTGSGALGYFYFNGTDQYGANNTGTTQTIAFWVYEASFIAPPLGKVNYIVDSASHNAVYLTALNKITLEYADPSGSLVSYEVGSPVAAGSYNTVRVTDFGPLFGVTVVLNRGSQFNAPRANVTQSPFTRFGRKIGSNNSYFTGRLLNFNVSNLSTTSQNNYNFNEGNGTEFKDTIGSADFAINNLTSAGGGWDY